MYYRKGSDMLRFIFWNDRIVGIVEEGFREGQEP